MLFIKLLATTLLLSVTAAPAAEPSHHNVTCTPGAIQPVREVDCDHAINSTIHKNLIQVEKPIEIFHGSCIVHFQPANSAKLELDPTTVWQAKLKILNACENYPGILCITSDLSMAISFSEAGLDPEIQTK